MTKLADCEPIASSTSWPRRTPPLVAPRASAAMARAHARIEAQANRAVCMAIKDRARAYALRPRDLDAISEDLSSLTPRILVAFLRLHNPKAYRWFGFGGEVSAINLRGALLYARWSRRVANRRK